MLVQGSVYKRGAPCVIHKAYYTLETILDICSSLDRLAVSHTPPPVLLPTLGRNYISLATNGSYCWLTT
jgi:hypothetical protein